MVVIVASADLCHGGVRVEYSTGYVAEVDQCGLVPITEFGIAVSSRRILDNGDLEAVFRELAKVCLNTQVR